MARVLLVPLVLLALAAPLAQSTDLVVAWTGVGAGTYTTSSAVRTSTCTVHFTIAAEESPFSHYPGNTPFWTFDLARATVDPIRTPSSACPNAPATWRFGESGSPEHGFWSWSADSSGSRTATMIAPFSDATDFRRAQWQEGGAGWWLNATVDFG